MLDPAPRIILDPALGLCAIGRTPKDAAIAEEVYRHTIDIILRAEALAPQVDLASCNHGHCPICGWEADFAVITPGADRRLFCGRCVAQWSFAPLTCPFCANDDRALTLTSP